MQVHRAGTIERDDGDDVFEAVGLEPHEQVAHAGTFQLEDAGGFAGGEQREGLGIVEGQLLHDKGGSVRMPLRSPACSARVDHGQGLQTEEVELHQADFLHVSHGILGDDFVLGTL